MMTGKTITATRLGLEGPVGKRLGGGLQGDVYEVTLGGQRYAVKRFKKKYSTPAKAAHVDRLIARGAPHPSFCSPIDAGWDDGRLLVFMRVVPEGMVKLPQLSKLAAPPTLRASLLMGFNLATAQKLLHAGGLVFVDWSPNQIFVDVDTGEAAIVDCDNADFVEEITSLIGTPGHMTQALARGLERPSVKTDRYSLATTLFELLLGASPLLGSKESALSCPLSSDYREFFVERPVFVFSSQDASNRPDAARPAQATMLSLWPKYPALLKSRFEHSFTQAIFDSSLAITEGAWRRTLAKLQDLLMTCRACGAEAFADHQAPSVCWKCRRPLPDKPKLEFRSAGRTTQELPLSPATILFTHHVTQRAAYDFTPAGAVAVSRGALGLTNLTQEPWLVRRKTGGRRHEAAPGQAVRLEAGMSFEFAGSTALVVA